MTEVISDTSPVLYLHRIGKLDWLRELFSAVLIPEAVSEELREGRRRGYDVPHLDRLESGMWISESLRRRVLALAEEESLE